MLNTYVIGYKIVSDILMLRFLLLTVLIITFGVSHVSANSYDDNEILDANQHVIMFEKGVDSFMAGDYEKCDDYWLPLARAGDYMAARNMALLYHRGIGVRKDLEEAELFYRLAADNGITEAQTVLGTLLIKGDEFKRNLPDAVQYLTAAYRAGDAVAAWNLGLLYENGIQVEKNLEKAMSLFQIAARGGHEPAMMRISGQPQDGYAPPPEITKAINENLEKDVNFDARPKPVIPEPKTFAEKVKIDEENDKNYLSDQINFQKELQSDDPDVALKIELGHHKRTLVGIDRELDPFGISKSRENRLDESFDIDDIGDNPQFIKANQAYSKKQYGVAKQIWQELFEKSLADEAAYRLGKLYFEGKGVPKNLAQTYFYWKKGADAGGQKSLYALEEFRSQLSDQELLSYEQKIM